MKRATFFAALAAILALYTGVEVAYAIRAPRGIDEFGTAYSIHQLTTKLAYRDYDPAKTALGFYVELPPIAWVSDGWDAMTATKIEIAILNAIVLGFAAVVLACRFDPRAVLASLLMLVVMTNFLERSAELRVDAIAVLFGLIALLCLVARKPFVAGIAVAASFLSTQKAIYFVVAAGVALLALLLRDRNRERLRQFVLFGVAAAATLVAYIAFWSAVSSPRAVIRSIFFNPNVTSIALEKIYDIRWHYWSQTLVRNPLFYACAVFGLIILGRRWIAQKTDDVITPFALVIVLLAIWHKQPWPHFFALVAPTLFVLNAAAIDSISAWPRRATTVFAVAFVALGLLLPMAHIPRAVARDASFQHAMFDAGGQLLGPGETYIDGTGMLYRREQTLPFFMWLDGARIAQVRAMNGTALHDVTVALERQPPKLLIWNYRLSALPAPLRLYFDSRYAPLYGDIFFYAPIVAGPRFAIAFDGSYDVGGNRAIVDGVPAAHVVELRRGVHTLRASTPIRLRLLPPRGIRVDPRYAAPQDLYPNLYDF